MGNQLVKFNDGRLEEEDMLKMCFMSTYTFQTFYNGYGFRLDDAVSAVKVVKGQKVGWALGSMLYEINTLPWTIIPNKDLKVFNQISFTELTSEKSILMFMGVILSFCVIGACIVISNLRRRHSYRKFERQVMSSSRSAKPLNRRAKSQPNYFSIMEESSIMK